MLRNIVESVAVGAGVSVLSLLVVATASAATVEVRPGQQIQAVVDANPPGTTFLLKSGVHLNQTIRPRNGDKYVGETGTVLFGGRRLTQFYRSGNYWAAPGQTQQGTQNWGICQASHPRCSYPEDLYINGERLEHVSLLSGVKPPNWAVEPGQFYFDYAADTIYVSYDPTWLRIETAVTPMAFAPTADNVTVTGLTIEMYAGIAQQGAIHAGGRIGWTITNNEIRRNHGVGITFGGQTVVRGNYVHNNGQLGISGSGDDLLVENNEIFNNNRAKYHANWEAGGTKFSATRRLVVRGNFVHHNGGPGLWTDIDNIDTLYENNRAEDNERMGIFHEISYAAVIRNNIVKRNGFGLAEYIWGAGILVAGSPDVEIYGNWVEGNADGIGASQQNRGVGPNGPHELWNLRVHHNTIVNNKGWTGVVQDVGDRTVFTSRGNVFYENRYVLPAGGYPFTWMDTELVEGGWQGFGHDGAGMFTR